MTKPFPANVPIHIIKKTKDFLFVVKPHGVKSTENCPNSITREPSLAHYLERQLKAEEFKYEVLEPCYGISKNAHGIMAYIHNYNTLERLKSGEISFMKHYAALVHSSPVEKEGIIRLPIRNSKIDFKGDEAETYYRVENRLTDKYSLLHVACKTNISNQIELHLDHLKCPLIGDNIAAYKAENGMLREELSIKDFPKFLSLCTVDVSDIQGSIDFTLSYSTSDVFSYLLGNLRLRLDYEAKKKRRSETIKKHKITIENFFSKTMQ
ncbi:hypothetical protein ROZALSC1DRAFT_30480 [Rozella allomycis CSF55]|uniref:Pseudouridine synthase RsuA/RluA-like domain-containing protein n=1 Tax=Rozella allomycis (strain CSF55) TaxID=988480 RepID=A0A4P9YEV8_ROZAC|nr:hypothetical protein ROZALSC1DRAFT_30480 [Rozella allomycis CSF55]